MTTNPIIQRELISLLRRPRAMWIQVGFVVALSALVLAVWPDSATVNLGGRQAQQLLTVFVYGLLVMLLLVAPAQPAMAIVRERQQGTLPLLLASPLTPVDILVGKVSGAIGFILLLLLLSLPAAAACYTMGGIALSKLATAYGVLTLVAVEYAMIALLVSSWVKSTDGALRMTYGVVLLTAVIVLGPFYLTQGKPLGPVNELFNWLAALSPVPAVMQVIGHETMGTRGLEVHSNQLGRYVVVALVVIVGCTVGLLRRLQPHVTDRPRSKGVVTDEQSSETQWLKRILYLWGFDPNRRTGSIADYENPVMMKEFRTRTFGRAHWMARLISVCLIVSIALAFLTTQGATGFGGQRYEGSYMGGVIVIFQMGLILLVTPALSAALISSELEGGGWVLMQMTPLRARTIVLGKLLSVGWTLTLLLLATLPGYAVLLMIDEGKTAQVQQVLIGLVLTSVFALMVGAACSSAIRTTATATTAAYILLLSLCVLTLLPWLGEGTLFGRSLVETMLIVNPLAATLAAIDMPGLMPYKSIITANWVFLGVGSAVCAAVLWVRTWQLTRPQ